MATHDIRTGASVDIKYNLRGGFLWSGSISDKNGDPVNLTGKELVYSIRGSQGGAAITTLTVADGDIVVSGVNGDIVTITSSSPITGLEVYKYDNDLENTDDDEVLFDGYLYCGYGAYGTD